MERNVDQKIIGLDMDGVIIDHSKNRIKIAADFGFQLDIKQTPPEIIRTVVPKDILDQIKNLIYDDPKIAMNASLIPSAADGLRQLKKNKTPYFLISMRRNPKRAQQVLEKCGLWPEFLNNNNAFFVKRAEDKNEKAKTLGITHYVDDENRVLEKIPDVKNKFLFDSLDVFEQKSGFIRVNSWPELLKHIAI